MTEFGLEDEKVINLETLKNRKVPEFGDDEFIFHCVQEVQNKA